MNNYFIVFNQQNRKQILRFGFFTFLLLTINLSIAQEDCFPAKPEKQRLVNDFAGLLEPAQQQQLERELVNFNDTTSIQIAVVTVKSLCSYDRASFAFQLGEQWGVGDKEFNTGVVVLVKPKVKREKGQVFIATGYGMEGVLPDATNSRIVQNEMIPRFKKNDYFGGIAAAARVIMEISGGEYSAENYNQDNKKSSKPFPVLPFIILLFFVGLMLAGTVRRASKYAKTNDVGLWTALFLMGSMSGRHRGHYSNFSSGRGGFGGSGGFGGGGGFGGFGGGSFGGGGAGGSW